MNTPNPLVPQSSLLEQQQKSKTKSNLFIAVITILTLHVAVFGGLLIQGCKRDTGPTELAKNPTTTAPTTAELPAMDTNALVHPGDTNAPVVQPIATPPGIAAAPSNVVGQPGMTPTPAIETAVTPTPAAAVVEGKDYTVARGDSFFTIAKAHGVSVSAVTKANPNVDAKKLKVGQTIKIPSATAAAAVAPASTTPGSVVAATEPGATPEGKASTYAVKPGDTLTRIAKDHGTTVKAIRAANNMKTDRLHVGQKIKIPKGKPAAAPAETNKPMSPVPAMPPASGAPGVTLPMSSNAQ
jgi:LysM repeat protein